MVSQHRTRKQRQGFEKHGSEQKVGRRIRNAFTNMGSWVIMISSLYNNRESFIMQHGISKKFTVRSQRA